MAKTCRNCKKLIPPGHEKCPQCGGPAVDIADLDDEGFDILTQEGASAVDLGKKPDYRGAALSDLRLVDEAMESDALELPRAPRTDPVARRRATGSDTELVEELSGSASSINLGPDAPAELGSGGDLIAESVEWAANQKPSTPPASGESDSVLEGLGGPHGKGDETSAVDLGSSDVIEVPQDGAGGAVRESSAVDLGSSEVIEIPQAVIDAAMEGEQASAAPEARVEPARTAPAAADHHHDDEGSDILDLGESPETPAALRRRVPAAALAAGRAEADDRAARPSRGPGRFANMAIGAGVGCLLCLLLWAIGVEPPEALRMAGGKAQPAPVPVPSQAPVVVRPAEDALAQLKSGDLDRALPALQNLDESKAENLAARGMALWWQYVREQKRKHAPLKKEDEPVKEAVGYLTKANELKNADALFWLAKIQEETGNVSEARKLYEQGARDFPQERPVFQAQLDRTEAAGRTESRLPASEHDLALLMISLLPTGQPEKADEPAVRSEEAGPEFFKALKLAQQNNYDAALQALQKAKAIHDEQRFNRLRKAQNPLSDPTEEVFLRSCDELRTYWEMRSRLNKDGYLAKQRDPVKALDAALADLEKATKATAQLKADSTRFQAVAAKLKQAQFNDADPAKSLDQLLSVYHAAKAGNTQLAELAAKLKEAKLEDSDPAKVVDQLLRARAEAQTQLETVNAKLKEIGAKLTGAGIPRNEDPVTGVAEVIASRTQADQALTEIAKKVEEVAKFASPKPEAADVVRGVERVVELARTKNTQSRPGPSQTPIIQRLESDGAPNPLRAAEHYAAGLNYFFTREYAQAEKQFAEAAHLENQDARYYYFLGLSRLQQNAGDPAPALTDFREAARLERLGRPATPAVNSALERVQGGLRQELDRYRP
jgi:hypothetical protein